MAITVPRRQPDAQPRCHLHRLRTGRERPGARWSGRALPPGPVWESLPGDQPGRPGRRLRSARGVPLQPGAHRRRRERGCRRPGARLAGRRPVHDEPGHPRSRGDRRQSPRSVRRLLAERRVAGAQCRTRGLTGGLGVASVGREDRHSGVTRRPINPQHIAVDDDRAGVRRQDPRAHARPNSARPPGGC
jgi:hypothetical protein